MSSAAWRPSSATPRRPKTATTTTTTLRPSPSSSIPSTSQPSQRLRISSSSSSSGSIWDSEVVQKEFEVMMRDFADVSNWRLNCWRRRDRAAKRRCALAENNLKLNLFLLSQNKMMRLQRGFPDFDLDGKEIYLDKVRGECFSFGIGERGGEENRGRDVFLVLFAHRLSLLFSLFPSSLSVVSPPPPAPQYSARWPLREDAHLRYQDAPVRGRGGEGVAAPGERGVETCFLSFSALFSPCRCLFSLFFSDLETFPPKKYKNKTKSSSTSSSSRPVSASTRCRKGKKRIS